MKFFLFLLLVLGSPKLQAISDIQLDVRLLAGNLVKPGEVAELEVTIRNNGPDTATNVAVGTIFLVGAGKSTISVGANADTPPCTIGFLTFSPRPGEPTLFSATMVPSSTVPSNLLPNQEMVCLFGLTTFEDSPGLITQRFNGFPNEDDPNTANNVAVLHILSGNSSLPVPAAESLTLLIMALFIGVLGVGRLADSRRG